MVGIIERAIEFAAIKHAGHKRKYTNAPYITHLLAVADLVRSVGGSNIMIAAAVLHDTLEDTTTTLPELRAEFGETIATLVLELTNVYTHKASTENRKTRKAKELARLATISPEAMTIKVADIIDNTKSIAALDANFAKIYLPEKKAALDVLTKADPTLLAKARASLMRHIDI